MAALSTGARMAGKALEEFHDIASSLVGEKVVSALGSKIPEKAAKFVSPATKLASSAALTGAESLAPSLFGRSASPEYARQPYRPGTMPLTNEQAGYLYLDQMKTQNQLAVLQARQSASVPTRMAPMFGAVSPAVAPEMNVMGDPYGSLMGAINTTYSY